MFATALLTICLLGGAAVCTDESEGATATVGTYYSDSGTMTLSVGSGYVYMDGGDCSASPSSSNGLSASISISSSTDTSYTFKWTVSGTPASAGTASFTFSVSAVEWDEIEDGNSKNISKSETVTVQIKSASVPVTGISISGKSSVEKGSSISLSASVSPSNATDGSVSWSVESGSQYVSISSGGKSCTVTGTSAGSATIRCTANDGSGVYRDFTVTVTEQAKQTYYARLYYNASGGSGAPSEQSDSIYAASASGSKSFTVSSTVPTRSGWEFKGWSTTSGSTVAEYHAGDTIAVPYDGSKTLYAVWEQVQYTSTLKFDANGGSNAPEVQQYTGTSTASHTFTIPSNIPTKSGSEFRGWAESSLADKASYQPGSTISVAYDGTKTLYAVWGTPQLTISSEPVKTVKVGQAWSYTPSVNVDGCTVTVTGADWLSVSSGTISGTPAKVGSYEVTVKVSKTGYSDAVQTFTLKVCSQYDSAPSAQGIFAYAE